jgi:hypothetical protein
MPPSIGETVAAARGWSQKYEQARLAEAAKPVGSVPVDGAAAGTPEIAATESSAPESAVTESAASAHANVEPTQPETAANGPAPSSEAAPEAPAQAAGAAVNHHG